MKRLSKSEKARFQEMGRNAFKAGLPSMPIRDAALMKEVYETNDMGMSAKKMQAWASGWHQENASNANELLEA